VALPCTDKLISTQAASLLRAAGINAVMAHKGEGLVRFNGLEAVNGDGLAVAGAASKKVSSGARFAVQSKIDTEGRRVALDDAPAVRRAGPVPAAAEAVDEPAEEAAEESSEEPVPVEETTDAAYNSPAEAPAAEATVASGDELTTLLASLDEPAESEPAESEPAAEEAPMDPELAALLKSLG
jgi:type VI secretion system protein ImpC